MNNTNYISLLGQYYGEPELATFLTKLGVSKPPKLPRGEADVCVECKAHGVEITFRSEHSLDIAFREYPEGALVLSSILFYGIKYDGYDVCQFSLPLNLLFKMGRDAVTMLLGKHQWENANRTSLRWDRERHCVFAHFDKQGHLERLRVQLPVNK